MAALTALIGAPFLVHIAMRSAAQIVPVGARRAIAEFSETPPRKATPDVQKSGDVSNNSLTHDFGVVPPGSVVAWAYPIHNMSDFAWTIDRVHVRCRCTVPHMSARTIAPGTRESVALQLDCGEEIADIEKTATVYLKEREIAPVRLQIKARVRAPLTPSARELSFGVVAPGTTKERSVTLANYSHADWQSVRAECSAPWIEVKTIARAEAKTIKEETIYSGSNAGARQVWRALVRIVGIRLVDGYQQASVRCFTDVGDECQIYVTACVEPPVRLVPDKLVFGPARPGEVCTRVARMIVREGIRVTEIRTQIDAKYLAAELRQINDRIWQIKAKMEIPSDAHVPDGQIGFSFSGELLTGATLPYSFFDPPDAP